MTTPAKGKKRSHKLGRGTFFIDGERITKTVYRERKPMPRKMWISQCPKISRLEAIAIREAFNDGCNESQIREALGRFDVSDNEIRNALFGSGDYRWLRFFHPEIFFSIESLGIKYSASGEYIAIDPKKKAPRVLCSVCGKKRTKQNLFRARRVDLSVWFFSCGELRRGVACSETCKKKANSSLKGEIEWYQKQQYLIDLAKKHLKKLRRLVRQRSQGVASQTRVMSRI
jgi:hypothetical protein